MYMAGAFLQVAGEAGTAVSGRDTDRVHDAALVDYYYNCSIFA